MRLGALDRNLTYSRPPNRRARAFTHPFPSAKALPRFPSFVLLDAFPTSLRIGYLALSRPSRMDSCILLAPGLTPARIPRPLLLNVPRCYPGTFSLYLAGEPVSFSSILLISMHSPTSVPSHLNPELTTSRFRSLSLYLAGARVWISSTASHPITSIPLQSLRAPYSSLPSESEKHLLILSATPTAVQAHTSLPPRPMSTGVTDIRTIPFFTHLSHSGTHRFFFHCTPRKTPPARLFWSGKSFHMATIRLPSGKTHH